MGSRLTSHQLDDMRSSLLENDVQVLRVALLKLLLEESAAVLVLAQGIDLSAGHGLEVVVHEAVGICDGA